MCYLWGLMLSRRAKRIISVNVTWISHSFTGLISSQSSGATQILLIYFQPHERKRDFPLICGQNKRNGFIWFIWNYKGSSVSRPPLHLPYIDRSCVPSKLRSPYFRASSAQRYNKPVPWIRAVVFKNTSIPAFPNREWRQRKFAPTYFNFLTYRCWGFRRFMMPAIAPRVKYTRVEISADVHYFYFLQIIFSLFFLTVIC